MKQMRFDRRSLAGWLGAAALILAAAMLGAPGALAEEGSKPHVEVYGFVQADYIQDFDRVHPDWEDTLRPSQIPTEEGLYGDDGQASVSAKQSRLGVLMNFPTGNRAVYTKFEFDMFGVGEDAGQTTIRLRHAYGQWGPWLAGQTNSAFMDASIFPNVVDYWGPPGMVFVRTPQIRWTPISGENSFAVALERPGSDVDAGKVREFGEEWEDLQVEGSEELPDLTLQYRREQDWGHFQVAGILRQISWENIGTPDNEPKGDETGWGIDATSAVKLGEKCKLLLGVVYGEGIATFMNDGGMDLAPQVSGPPEAPTAIEAELVPLLGVSAYLDVRWSEKFSSSFGYSETSVDNTNYQEPDAYETGRYASANLLYYPTENMFVGAELLWGEREDNGGANGEDMRVQVSFHYSFSTKDIFKKN